MAQTNPNKRKRAASASPSPFSAGAIARNRRSGELAGTINPLSYTPSTLRQLRVAGHPEAELLPSDSVPQFPHRPLPPDLLPAPPRRGSSRTPLSFFSSGASSAGETDVDEDAGGEDEDEEDGGDEDDPAQQTRKERLRQRRSEAALRTAERHRGVLTAIVHRSLEEGAIAQAKRAFALLVRSEAWGKPIDLRQNSYWAVGAEILMRKGEEELEKRKKNRTTSRSEQDAPGVDAADPSDDDDDVGSDAEEDEAAVSPPGPPTHRRRRRRRRRLPRRWGRAENMARVREYFMTLIVQYPYNKFHPFSVSALDFWPALFGCELYNTHAEHRRALHQLDADVAAAAAVGSDENRGAAIGDDDDDDFAMRLDGGGGGGDSDTSSSSSSAMALDNPNPLDQRRRAARPPSSSSPSSATVASEQRRLRDALRLDALRQMRDVAKAMDDLMGSGSPYASSHELLRLRGMVALYMGDLAMPTPTPTPGRRRRPASGPSEAEEHEGRTQRAAERERARQKFRRIIEDGGEAEPWMEAFVNPSRRRRGFGDDGMGEEEDEYDFGAEDDEESSSVMDLPVFSSLPIRGR